MTNPTPLTLEFDALTEPVSRAEVRDFRRVAQTEHPLDYPSDISGMIGRAGFIVVLGIISLGFAAAIAATFVGIIVRGDFAPINLVLLAIAVAIVVSYAVFVVHTIARGHGDRWMRWTRMSAFAEANHLVFTPSSTDPGYPGMMFAGGTGSTVFDRLTDQSGRTVDMGDYLFRPATNTSKESMMTVSERGYLAVQLDRRLPNIVLDSRANRSALGTSLPDTLNPDQVVSLEGDFDRYFTLYCPKGFETDALSIITPDLMALLIDQAARFEVEIVEDWLFVFAAGPLNFSDASTVRHMFRIANTVGVKAADRSVTFNVATHRRDTVPIRGRRLAHGRILAGTITMGIFAAIYLTVSIIHLTSR